MENVVSLALDDALLLEQISRVWGFPPGKAPNAGSVGIRVSKRFHTRLKGAANHHRTSMKGFVEVVMALAFDDPDTLLDQISRGKFPKLKRLYYS